jgi:hypothetical protein
MLKNLKIPNIKTILLLSIPIILLLCVVLPFIVIVSPLILIYFLFQLSLEFIENTDRRKKEYQLRLKQLNNVQPRY